MNCSTSLKNSFIGIGVILGVNIGMLKTPPIIAGVIKPKFMFDFCGTVGLMYGSTEFHYYALIGAGVIFGETQETWLKKSVDKKTGQVTKTTEMNTASYIQLKASVGAEYKLLKKFGVYAQGNMYMPINFDVGDGSSIWYFFLHGLIYLLHN